jgi:hypothetical protein
VTASSHLGNVADGPRKVDRYAAYILSLVCLLLSLAGASAAYRELSLLWAVNGSPSDIVARLSSSEMIEPLALRSEYALIEACYQASFSLSMMIQPLATRAQLMDSCRRRLSIIEERSPVNGFAWVVSAELDGYREDAQALARDLRMSISAAPYEQWLAQRRVEVVERYGNLVGSTTRADEDQDLAVLVASSRGIQFVARRYLQDAAFRDRVLAVVEALSETQQARFIAEVRRVSSEKPGESAPAQ